MFRVQELNDWLRSHILPARKKKGDFRAGTRGESGQYEFFRTRPTILRVPSFQDENPALCHTVQEGATNLAMRRKMEKGSGPIQ